MILWALIKRLYTVVSTSVLIIFGSLTLVFGSHELREHEKQEEYSVLRSFVYQIKNKIDQNWVDRHVCDGMTFTLLVKININGDVISLDTIESDGSDACRRSAEDAVYNAAPLSLPDNPRYFKYLHQGFEVRFKP